MCVYLRRIDDNAFSWKLIWTTIVSGLPFLAIRNEEYHSQPLEKHAKEVSAICAFSIILIKSIDLLIW